MAALVSMLSKALMWLIRQSTDQQLLPWVMVSTNELVPTLHKFMLQAKSTYPEIGMVRWK
eukprot:SAG11_NODE_3534_length_2386_cov_3.060778_2_plen_60_part_00